MNGQGTLAYEPAKVERGYTDRILHVDLSDRTLQVREVPEEMRRRYVGGRGYCLKLVYDGTTGATRHDSPENVLALAGGPYCGETAWVGSGKFIVGTLSPLTGSFCDSNVGGHFFPLVKLSGFDAVAITGRSATPVMLVIDGDRGEARLQDTTEAYGSLIEAEQLLGRFQGDGDLANVSALVTGKGGLTTRFGCLNSIYFDRKRKRCRSKQAGRGGTGSVMAGKGLWGIVVRNNRSKAAANGPADPDRIRMAGSTLRKVIREEDPKHMRMYAQGTTSLIEMMNAVYCLPVNNYQYGRSPEAAKMSGEVFEKNYFRQGAPDGCFPGCNLACTKGCDAHELTTGPLRGRRVSVDGPEYETAAAVTNLGIFDPDFIMDYSWYCDEYGIDTISAGVTLSFLFEAYEQGVLTREDTDGLELRWGSVEAASELLHAMVESRGIGLHAGRGVRYMKGWIARKAAERTAGDPGRIEEELGRFAMECKGLEFSMYRTKESLAQQGGYGFALKGAQHDESWLIALDQVRNEMPTFEQKAQALMWFPLFRAWFNLVGLCKLPWIDVRHPDARNTEEPAKNLPTVRYYLEMVNATLGSERTLEDLLLESEISYTLHKLINLRQGFGTREHDLVPLRAMAPVFLNEFLVRKDYYEDRMTEFAGLDIEGRSDEEKLSMLQAFRRAQYEKLCDTVYEEKGYDRDGIPRKSTLLRLGFHEPEYMAIVDEARRRVQARAGERGPDKKLAN